MFFGSGRPLQCPGRCVPTTVAFARCALGLDPDDPKKQEGQNADAIFESLEREGKDIGSTIRRVTVADVIENIAEGPSPPVLLVHKTGHLYVLFGAIRVNDKLLYQVVHGNEAVSLIAKQVLLESDFQEAWRLENVKNAGVPIHIGSTVVEIDKLWHNFGEVFPDKPLECLFRIKNVGSKSVILQKPVVSCSCTVPNLTAATTLAPGATLNMVVTSRPPGNTSLRNTIELTFFEKGGVASREVQLSLIGSMRASMDVVPRELDFGVMVPGNLTSRIVSLVEKPTDRFTVKQVDAGDLHFVHDMKVTRGRDGLATYRLHLKLSIDDESPGEHEGSLVLTTDSHTRPKVTIPVKFKVEPPIRSVPSVISLGSITLGETHLSQVQFLSRDHKLLDIQVESHPDECEIRINKVANPPEMSVAFRLKTLGIWQGAVKVKAVTVSGEKIIEIKCIAYVH